MSKEHSLTIYDAQKNEYIKEKIYGGAVLKWLYTSGLGKSLFPILTRRGVSVLYGAYQAHQLSKKKVIPFIENFSIDMDEYIDPGFETFNDFFIRQFRVGKRNFTQDSDLMPAPCEARYLGYETITPDLTFPVKGEYLTAKKILNDHESYKYFEGGPLIVARLCPLDYHRFHFPDDGIVSDEFRVSGLFHSVNPFALKTIPEIFCANERHVSIFETKNFGKLAYIEVGAMCVGKIVQNYEGPEFKRGDEKGYFLFGASTVVLLGEPGKWKPSELMLEKTRNNEEVFFFFLKPIANLIH